MSAIGDFIGEAASSAKEISGVVRDLKGDKQANTDNTNKETPRQTWVVPAIIGVSVLLVVILLIKKL